MPTSSYARPLVRFDGDRRFSGWLPFDLELGSHIVVAATINGVPISAVIDSGAGRTVIDRRVADGLRAHVQPGFRAAGVTADAHGGIANDLSIRIGHLVLSQLNAGVLDLSGFSTVMGRPLHLVVGQELFEQVLVDLDFSQRHIGLLDLQTSVDLPEGAQIAFRSDERGRRYVPMSIGGAEATFGCYDLGSDVPLLISQKFASDNNLLVGCRQSSVASRGVGGISIGRVAVVPSVEIGGVQLTDVPVEIPATWNQAGPILAGLPIWSRFRNVIDFSRNRLSLAENPSAISTPFPKDRSGIGASRSNDRLLIIHVAEGSPAESLGLKVGDEILAIDRHLVDAAYLKSHLRIGARPAGTKVELKLGDGRTLHMVLADYF